MGDDRHRRVETYLVALEQDSQQWSDERAVIVRCRRCRNLIAEVMSTPFGRAELVVVHRGFLRPDAPMAPLSATGKETGDYISLCSGTRFRTLSRLLAAAASTRFERRICLRRYAMGVRVCIRYRRTHRTASDLTGPIRC
jgi:hypothetical protein